MSATVTPPKAVVVKKQIQVEQAQPPKRENVFEKRRGKRITFQMKGGVLITGTLISYKEGFVKLVDPVIRGRSSEARPPYVFVDRAAIAHFHPECEVGAVEEI